MSLALFMIDARGMRAWRVVDVPNVFDAVLSLYATRAAPPLRSCLSQWIALLSVEMLSVWFVPVSDVL